MSGAALPKNSALVESRGDLIEAIASGAKPKAEWRVGTEHEKFSFYIDGNRPVPYHGEAGIAALLESVQQATGASPIVDNEHVIGLRSAAGWAISLEPGGQFELSGAPQVSMHDTARETAEHMAVAKAAAGPLGIGFLAMGVVPTWKLDEVPLMPKSRYAIMRPYMDRVGTLGSSMMMRTCTIQSNLDFGSEADMVKKLRVAVALQPVATALFANSPFVDGKPSGFLSFRSHIWLNTDNARTGMLPFAFDDGFGYERYVDYALDVPMYFVIRDGKYVNVAGESFRAFLEGRLPQLPGDTPTVTDWENHLSTLFPEVRLKKFLEMRGADMGSEAAITALSAFWTGLLYDDLSLDAAWELVKNWSNGDRQALRTAVPRTGLKTPMPGEKLRFGTIADLAKEIVGIAEAGLVRRGLTNAAGEDETKYLARLEDTLMLHAESPAELLLQHFNAEWGCDVTPAFEANRL